jgi:hypothetical protein
MPSSIGGTTADNSNRATTTATIPPRTIISRSLLALLYFMASVTATTKPIVHLEYISDTM